MLLLIVVRAQGQGTAFTYQGRLEDGGRPANGLYDIQFQMFDKEVESNLQFSTAPQMHTLDVTNGVFTTVLDFLDLYEGGRTFYLELSVRPAGSAGALEKLAPRQRITPTPYAIRAGGLTGTLPAHQLPSGVLRTDGSGRIYDPIQAMDSRNVFGGDGSNLTGVKAAAVGLRYEVRVQDVLYRRLPHLDRGDLANSPCFGVVAGDFNGDGKLDLIGSRGRYGMATLHTNAGGGRLIRAAGSDLGGVSFSPKQAVKGLFNADNLLDLAVWTEWASTINLITNSSGGEFRVMASISITNVSALTAIDVNRDGLMDLAVSHSVDNGARLRIYLNSGNSMVAAASLILPSAAADLIAVDMTGDGAPELVAACVVANEIRMFVNQGGFFPSHVAIPAYRPRALAYGVVDSSSPGFTYVSEAGYPDGMRYEESMIRSIRRNEDGSFVDTATRLPVGSNSSQRWVKLDVRDFNGDSRNDVIAAVLWGGGADRVVRYDSQFNAGEPRRVLDWISAKIMDVEFDNFDDNPWMDLGTGVEDGVAVWVTDSGGVSTYVPAQFESSMAVTGQFNAMGGATISGNATIAGGLEVNGPTKFFGAVSTDQWSVSGPLTVSGSSTLSDVAINGDLRFGTRTRQMLNLYGTGYGIGVQPETLYFRAVSGDGAGFAWFAGGSHVDSRADPGDSGKRWMRLTGDGLSVAAGGGGL